MSLLECEEKALETYEKFVDAKIKNEKYCGDSKSRNCSECWKCKHLTKTFQTYDRLASEYESKAANMRACGYKV